MTAAQLRDTLVQIALAGSERERLRLIGSALMQDAPTETIPGLLVTEFTPFDEPGDAEPQWGVAQPATQPAALLRDADPLVAFHAQYPLAVLALRGI